MSDRTRIGFLTYDLQEFTADCISRICRLATGFRVKAYPILPRVSERVDFAYRKSAFQARHKTFGGMKHTPEGFMISINWRAALACVRENDIVVLFGIQGGTALAVTAMAKMLGRKIVSVNQTLPPESEQKRRWWIRLLKGWVLHRCHAHVIQTPAARETLLDVYHLPQERFTWAPFEAGWSIVESLRREASRPESRSPSVDLGRQTDQCVFLFVGTLLRFKGVNTLLEALGRLRSRNHDAHVVFCGAAAASPDEPSISHYREIAHKLKIEESVTFAGNVPFEQLMHHYENCDVCVLPTSKDCWPKVLVEAASFEKPLITTTACGVSGSLVRDGETGRVVPPGDADALADAMEDMLDSERRREMGRRARAFCVDFCDAEKEAAGFVEALEMARAA